MDDVPDWKPDPEPGQLKIVLSKDVLRADDEDSISPQEYTQRHEQAEQDVRDDLLAHLDDYGESGLKEKRNRLKEREETAKAAVGTLLEKRRIALQAARSADALAEQYGSDVACGDAHFVAQGRYKHELPESDAPAHWRRDANALVAVTRDGDEVLRCSTETTFIALRNKALARHRRLEDPLRRKRKARQFFHLRRSVCENILYELDLGRDPYRESGGMDTGQTAGQRHTCTIGIALLRAERNGDRPAFGEQKTEFKKWAAKQIGRAPSTAYDAMVETGCWVKSRQGRTDTEALQRTIEEVMEFAKQHSSQLRNSEN